MKDKKDSIILTPEGDFIYRWGDTIFSKNGFYFIHSGDDDYKENIYDSYYHCDRWCYDEDEEEKEISSKDDKSASFIINSILTLFCMGMIIMIIWLILII